MRLEKDSMGSMEVPDDALYGASTQRAVLNFPISGYTLPIRFLHALAQVKKAAARANATLGRLSEAKAHLIERACEQIPRLNLPSQFPLDTFQTGSATSTHTNMNEVLATLASQSQAPPPKETIHPNDDVNLGQSSNDVIPTALQLSLVLAIKELLHPAVLTLEQALKTKEKAFNAVLKIGRTHFMDATPMSLGQEFKAFYTQIHKTHKRVLLSLAAFSALPVGGTAIGTGLNTHSQFGKLVCEQLTRDTKHSFKEASDHFEAQASRDDCVQFAGTLITFTASLTKLATDLRLLASGPRGGLGELKLPAVQPGSSIMPGKVNPVMSEMLLQVCYYTKGLCLAVMEGGAHSGNFQLNTSLPLLAHCLHESIRLLASATTTFAQGCVTGIEATSACQEHLDKSLMLVTALNPLIGYDQAATVAQQAFRENKSLKTVLLERKLLPPDTLDTALDPATMLKPSS